MDKKSNPRKRRRKKTSGAPRSRRKARRRATRKQLTLGELSGAGWVNRFPGSQSTADLASPFRSAVEAFIGAMTVGGARVRVTSTFRPPERAYLMHFAWKIAKNNIDDNDAPRMPGVDINWVHPTRDESVAAAQEMVDGYQMVQVAALNGRHTEGRAIDMSIEWSGSLILLSNDGQRETISTRPRSGNNTRLHAVGATYGVRKLVSDPPHWSEDGH